MTAGQPLNVDTIRRMLWPERDHGPRAEGRRGVRVTVDGRTAIVYGGGHEYPSTESLDAQVWCARRDHQARTLLADRPDPGAEARRLRTERALARLRGDLTLIDLADRRRRAPLIGFVPGGKPW